MKAADLRLVAMIIRRAKPHPGDAALGDALEISLRGIDLDGAFLDKTITPLGSKEMAKSFLLCEVDGLLDLAAEEGPVFLGNFKDRAVAGALG